MCRLLTSSTVALLLVLGDATFAQGTRSPSGRVAPDVQWDHGWLDGAVFYEIFVRSFADSDGDGVGDLQGLIARLDHLNDGDPSTTTDLGVDGIWLMPIMPSPSYHGYDVTDYEGVHPDYGTVADFEELAREAERRGLRVILDLVLNHSSSEHPWFLDAATGPGAARRDWYVWSPVNQGWTQPWGGTWPTWHRNPGDGWWYYGVFWGGMPDLNHANPAVRRESARLAALWLDRGAAGFRLDATRYLVETGGGRGQQDTPATHATLKELTAAVRRHDPRAMVVGENWADTRTIATYYGSTAAIRAGDELPLSFDFPLAEASLDALRSGSRAPVEAVLREVAASYPAGVRDAPFLTNHDQVRLATQLAGDRGRLRAAAAILLTVPGVSFLYYGEEVGLGNGTATGDEAKRTPMPWHDDAPGGGFTTGTPWHPFAPGRDVANVADQLADPGSLLAHYRGLIAARGASPALGAGAVSIPAHDNHSVLALVRDHPGQRALVLVNLTGSYQVAGGIAVSDRPETPIYEDGRAGVWSGGSGAWSLVLPPWGTAVWELR